MKQFSDALLAWFDKHGRKDLPWQHPRTAYRVWISEIMLQQTQVKTVIPYFNRFIASFPDIWQLAGSEEDFVLAHWSGLGYYSRARNLIKTAKIICKDFQGEFPTDLSVLISLPGIGPSTGAAISSQAFNQPTPILDGNVKRVLARHFLIDGWPEQAAIKQKLLQYAHQCMPKARCRDYTQAIMDLGALCCTTRSPRCLECPLSETCLARQQDTVLLYPQKKEKKVLPLKKQQFLVLYRPDRRFYLEKRPPTGIWGGLWCLPSLDPNHCPREFIDKTYGLTGLTIEKLDPFKHSFSHFHLELQPLALAVKPKPHHLAEPSGKWFSEAEINGLGLAKPISKIIQLFFKAASCVKA